jgi:RNA polymerase sigma factor (sigma-70 family)
VHDGTRSDADVLRASRDDPRQFSVLFERHFAVLFGYFARRLGRDAAEDLTAEVFLLAFERRGDYDLSYADARPWLFGIAANLVRRSRRSELRALRALSRRPAEGSPVDAETDASLARLDLRATRPALARALARLRADERDVLALVAWGELTYEEVARALSIPVGTVRSRLSRARARLRRELKCEHLSGTYNPAPVAAAAREDMSWMNSI